ncbi:DUF1963 domain-containing protein [Cesiribacter andamanensis]|uniref:DUF1963 domain-containing protein n=1 Tax=Cesiribacter andamanensis AMV16 TaxID=1279009 RepID=M7N6X5_9BACT|nr:DUF1963 domain-containing protein [Cesiribacter andamanensis]EMR04353.1 hypothetical protein ADICEAN_00516 [Cesiribacter andamanensis AMV16]
MGLFDKLKGILGSENQPDAAAPADGQDLLGKIAAYKRKTWMPLVEEGAEDEALASKIGGMAYLPPGETYPLCAHCQEPLTLFLQLNPANLPPNCDLDLEPDKLVQLFYCTNQHPHCELECKAWAPFAKSELARTLPLPATEVALPGTAPERQYPARLITEWVENEDYPDWHEMQLGAAGLSEQEVEALESNENTIPKAADKLGGWPYWVQGVEYPACPDCGLQMQMIFQLDSDHHLPYMFGDAGVAHLHQCRLHKGVLAFGWSSY